MTFMKPAKQCKKRLLFLNGVQLFYSDLAPGRLGMNPARLVSGLMLALAYYGIAIGQPAQSEISPRAKPRIEQKIENLKACIVLERDCDPRTFRQYLLQLDPSEVESILGPPQYSLKLTQSPLYFWTVSLKVHGVTTPVRIQVSYGNCNYRDPTSTSLGVCEATTN